jgi:hypothetical protein
MAAFFRPLIRTANGGDVAGQAIDGFDTGPSSFLYQKAVAARKRQRPSGLA